MGDRGFTHFQPLECSHLYPTAYFVWANAPNGELHYFSCPPIELANLSEHTFEVFVFSLGSSVDHSERGFLERARHLFLHVLCGRPGVAVCAGSFLLRSPAVPVPANTSSPPSCHRGSSPSYPSRREAHLRLVHGLSRIEEKHPSCKG